MQVLVHFCNAKDTACSLYCATLLAAFLKLFFVMLFTCVLFTLYFTAPNGIFFFGKFESFSQEILL